ncbi:formylglycine-generating enzyme family protein [Thermodesulfobacteriota bacterium]
MPKKILVSIIILLFSSSIAMGQDPKKGVIVNKDDVKRIIAVDLGSKDGVKVGSAYVLHDENDRELSCILVARVEEDMFWSDLIPMGSFADIEIGFHVEELGSGCRIEGVEVKYVPGGFFGMGDNKKDNEMPMRGVELKDFYIDKYEVTNEQYKIFMFDKKREAPHLNTPEAGPYNWKDNNFPEGKEDYPVVLVTHQDAKDFCEYMGKRLPTEAEWEKAARGTGSRIWPWGNVWDARKLNSLESGVGHTAIIGSFPDDLSPYDVMDMGGNVSEWTSSEYAPYKNNFKGDENYNKGYLVIRGGSFIYGKSESRAPSRKYMDPNAKSIGVGIRCVKDIN